MGTVFIGETAKGNKNVLKKDTTNIIALLIFMNTVKPCSSRYWVILFMS